VSGLRAVYDLSKPVKQRLVELQINGQPVDERRLYRVGTNSFLAQGGDLYQTFLQTKQTDAGGLLSEIVITYLREHRDVQAPKPGRLIPVGSPDRGAGYTIRRIEVVGNATTGHTVVMQAAGTFLIEGTPFDIKKLDDWVRGLNRLGRFKPLTKGNVELRFNDQERFVDITFYVVEKSNKPGRFLPVGGSERGQGYTIRRVEFTGNESVSDPLVFKTAGLHLTESYSPNKIDSSIKRINEFGRFEQVTKDNIEMKFDDQNRFVDILVHLREKPNRKPRIKRVPKD